VGNDGEEEAENQVSVKRNQTVEEDCGCERVFEWKR
jgi:hypothetical protein